MTLLLLGITLFFHIFLMLSTNHDSKNKNRFHLHRHFDRDHPLDRCDIFCSLSQEPIIPSLRIHIRCFFIHMPSDSLEMFLCFRISIGCVLSLFWDLYWISFGHLGFSSHKRSFYTHFAKSKILILISIPIFADAAGNLSGIWTSSDAVRLLTGVVWGIILPFYFLAGLSDYILHRKKSGKTE